MDGSGIWSKLSDTSQYVKAEINNSVTYSFEQKKHQIAALSNKLVDEKCISRQKFLTQRNNTLMLQTVMYQMYLISSTMVEHLCIMSIIH